HPCATAGKGEVSVQANLARQGMPELKPEPPMRQTDRIFIYRHPCATAGKGEVSVQANLARQVMPELKPEPPMRQTDRIFI
ncbi:MAG TPA: hypothetical protein VFV71_05385, partial [Burkholderiales bacterium]|nr:hypothetical protein [Burkholderiales bacterium]